MKQTLKVAAALLLALLWAFQAPAADYYGSQYGPTASGGASSDTAIVFYGKVVDQYGSPVYKAQVTGGKEYLETNRIRFFGLETARTETDAAGRFTFTGLLLKKLYIKAIEKRCFETLQKEGGIRSFSYDQGNEEPLYKPDPAQPVVFVLQKKFDPGLVDLKKTRMVLWPGMEGFTVDISRGFSDAMQKIPAPEPGQDIRVSLSPDREFYTLKIRAPGDKNGLAYKDGTPHIAPAEGYGPGFEFQIPASGASKVTLYHKGRAGKVYSRLELVLTPVSSGMRIAGELYTNIEGGKNTDFDSFHTEEELVRRTGTKLNYGGATYKETVAAFLQASSR